MAVLFSKEFKISKDDIERSGVFDVLLDEDSHFFINIKRLQQTEVPEFSGAYEKINEYFSGIGCLLKSSVPGDKLYRSALRKFYFPEVNGINLGFSSGNHGAGFGELLRRQIIKDAYEIIHTGSEQPEILHLTGLFEDNVGPDRLSDMIAHLIHDNIIAYSKRIYQTFRITQERYPSLYFHDGIPKNPYKKYLLLLLPVDILHELPIAKCWDDIDRVCSENDAIRAEINDVVSTQWYKMTSSSKKQYMKDSIFEKPEKLKRIIDSYRKSTIRPYNIFEDVDYLVGCLKSSMIVPDDKMDNSFDVSLEIIRFYQSWVENNRGSLVIKSSEPQKAEKIVQRTLHAVALMFCEKNNWDINPEEDAGRGPVDFKISRGNDKTVTEIKLTSNSECVHGLEVQIEEYAKAENTDKKIFILVDTGEHSNRISEVQNKWKEMDEKGLHPAKLVIVDSKPKASASKYKPSEPQESE